MRATSERIIDLKQQVKQVQVYILADSRCSVNLKKSQSYTKLMATGGGTGGGFEKSSLAPEENLACPL